MVTVFRDGSHRFGTRLIRILHFLPPYSPAPFFQTLVIDSENKKAALLVTGERLKIRSWEPAPFLKMKKTDEIINGAAHTTHESGKTVSNWLHRWEEINGNSKIHVNILP